MDNVTVSLKVNGKAVRAGVAPDRSLLAFLREDLGLLGTHEGCGRGDCGSCTVLLDGKPALSCIMFAFQADGREVVTIEGISDGERLDAVQKCFIDKGAIQCGFCTPGMILTAKGFLDEQPHPSEQEVKRAISGNLCRCTGYTKIVEAIMSICEKKT